MYKFLFVMGTRPEIIKMAPVVAEARSHPDIQAHILHTGQHKEMAEEMFKHFGLVPDYDLAVMKDNQSLYELTARITKGIGDILSQNHYHMVFVQGDTTSAFLGALCGFYAKIPVAHIEAGLRTSNKYSPFPEEINRRLVTPIASLHFPPTERAAKMLLKEGVPSEDITVSGNTVIDALLWTSKKNSEVTNPVIKKVLSSPGRMILVTAHRRENFGEPHKRVFSALLELADKFPDLKFVIPMHPNPNVRKVIKDMLSSNQRFFLTDPFDYPDFISAMKSSALILSDSGGVQEEAPSLNKPVLVLRESTERPEGLATGAFKLVGTDKDLIVSEASKLLTDKEAYETMAKAENPYGDGKASQRITEAALKYLSKNN